MSNILVMTRRYDQDRFRDYEKPSRFDKIMDCVMSACAVTFLTSAFYTAIAKEPSSRESQKI